MIEKVEISLNKKNYVLVEKIWNFIEKKYFFFCWFEKVEISLKKKKLFFGSKKLKFLWKKKTFSVQKNWNFIEK